jgi:hypothetical protein
MSAKMVSFCNMFQLEKLISEGTLHHDVIRFHYYVQYHLYMQVSIVCCCYHSELLIELLSSLFFYAIFIHLCSYQRQLHMQERKRLS